MQNKSLIRLETAEETTAVEALVREAFGMSTVPAVWSITFCTAAAVIRISYRN